VGVKQSIDAALDQHPADDEDQAQASWSVAVRDDCDGCDDLRVELVVEEVGRHGEGVTAHLSPDGARHLRSTLGAALRSLGEDPGT
jgi:hypothetical protein